MNDSKWAHFIHGVAFGINILTCILHTSHDGFDMISFLLLFWCLAWVIESILE